MLVTSITTGDYCHPTIATETVSRNNGCRDVHACYYWDTTVATGQQRRIIYPLLQRVTDLCYSVIL
jgi:hypothetical protein